MKKAENRILFAEDFQHVAEVVHSKIIGTKRAGDSWVIQANFPGSRNPNRELLYRPLNKPTFLSRTRYRSHTNGVTIRRW